MNSYARHIHLDFHTSELLSVGDNFDGDKFARTLTEANVNSIVVFAKCHHGWCYYPTKIGHMHPQLSFDLMGEQIKACRRAGIRVIAYITGAWSASDAMRHPEWQCVSFKTRKPMYALHGSETDRLPGEPNSVKPETNWPHMCMAGEYGEHVKALTREVLDNYDVDGLFFDIMGLNFPCVCEHCTAQMKAEGIDTLDRSSVLAFMIRERRRLLGELRDIVKEKGEDLTVFFNSGGANVDQPEYMEYSTHYEMENLAAKSTLGYDGISNRSKYFRETGKDVWGMTGKFHTSWGEFGGYKHPKALLQECAAMIAYGVNCNVGDQLHPSGEINTATYKLIGEAFEYVRSIEQYVDCGTTVSRLGMMLSESLDTREGLAKLLMDSHLDHSILMPDMRNLSRFDHVILSAPLTLTEEQERRLCDFSDRGGKLIIFGRIGGAERLLKKIGYTDLGASELDKDYVLFGDDELLDTPLLMYNSAHRFSMDGCVLAEVYEPYFSRTEGHYCSHRNTPNRTDKASYPAIVMNEKALCFAHDLGEQYFKYGNYWCRMIFERAISRIYTPEISFEGLPVYGRYTFYKKDDTRLLHLLGLNPIKRGAISVLEEPTRLFDIKVNIKGEAPKQIVLMPQNEEIDFKYESGEVSFTVPRLEGHQLIVLKD